MARIMTVTEDEAQGTQRELVARSRQTYGTFLGLAQVLLPAPEIAKPARQIYEHLNLRKDSPLNRIQREMLGTVAYGLVGGRSCLGLHTEALRRLTGDEHLSPEFAHTWPRYDIDEKTRALLGYVKKLTEQPYMIEDADVEALRDAGWNERGIYEATALVAFYNFSGRMEAAAGVPMDRPPAQARFPEAIPDDEEA